MCSRQIDQETTPRRSAIDGESTAQRQVGVGIRVFVVARERRRVAFDSIGDHERELHRDYCEFH